METLLISKDTIATRVVEVLRRRIIGGHYRGGMKLQQEQIAGELGVSRSPVREALRQLEAEGLVTLISQKGAEVKPISLPEVSEMFEMRLLLEPHLLALAIPNMTAADFSETARIIVAMDGADVDSWGTLNWELHRTLYRPADRPIFLRTLERVHQGIDRFLRLEMSVKGGRLAAKADHEKLVALCRRRESDAAVALLRTHIVSATSGMAELIGPAAPK